MAAPADVELCDFLVVVASFMVVMLWTAAQVVLQTIHYVWASFLCFPVLAGLPVVNPGEPLLV